MYTINQLQENGLSYIEIVANNQNSSAKICLDRGAALETLKLNKQSVIVDLNPLTYQDTYASSILFPFVNRIKDGDYSYKDVKYKFDCNEQNLNNALHGLVFDKTFSVSDTKVTNNNASVSVTYNEDKRHKAFPFLYTVTIKYTLSQNGINLSFNVKNNDQLSFPFTAGWHPYFLSDDLHNSSIEFSTSKEYLFDERMITNGEEEKEMEKPFYIKDQQLDNCYALKNGNIVFNTPKYKMKIESSAKENYFQMYTPPQKNIIALEPVTGISNSFNNKIGLQELEPQQEYTIDWNVHVTL